MCTESEKPGTNKCGFYKAGQRGDWAGRPDAHSDRRTGRLALCDRAGISAPGCSRGWPPPRSLLPPGLPAGVGVKGARPRGQATTRPARPARLGARGAGQRGGHHRGQVRGAGRGSLSPRCELIIQMGCPGSGDWRPAPARRAISPAAHVTAALVRSAVHTSSSTSPLLLHLHLLLLFLLLLLSTPPPAPTPRASRRLPAARHCQPRPPPGSPRARRRRRAAGAPGTGGARLRASSSPRPPPPTARPSRPLPTTASGRPRERGSGAEREGALEGGRGRCLG